MHELSLAVEIGSIAERKLGATVSRCVAVGVDAGLLAARFHESIVEASVDVARLVAGSVGLDTVVLAGGSFQNARLLTRIMRRLEESHLHALTAARLGPNDGAISYGQAAVAAWKLSRGE